MEDEEKSKARLGKLKESERILFIVAYYFIHIALNDRRQDRLFMERTYIFIKYSSALRTIEHEHFILWTNYEWKDSLTNSNFA